jgi:hypothetical protein
MASAGMMATGSTEPYGWRPHSPDRGRPRRRFLVIEPLSTFATVMSGSTMGAAK